MTYNGKNRVMNTSPRILGGFSNILRATCRLTGKFARKRDGQIAVTFALMVVPLLALTGVAVDMSRVYLARYVLQSSMDAGALAVGASYLDKETVEAQMEAYVTKNYNFSESVLLEVDGDTEGEDVNVNGVATVDTYFMGILTPRYKKVTVRASTDVKRAGGGLMVTLVLDNTGSMWSKGNIGSLREATQGLIDELFESEKNPEDLRVGIVPYASTVNLGEAATQAVKKADIEAVYNNYFGYVPTRTRGRDFNDDDKHLWKGCVIEREKPDTYLDTTSAGGREWKPFWYPPGDDNNYDPLDSDTIRPGGAVNSNQITGPNIGCPTPITALTNSYDKVKAASDALTAWNRGGTLTDIGVSWGLRVLSPGKPFDESNTETDARDGLPIWQSPRWRRAMMVMTDGENLFYDLPYKSDYSKKSSSYKKSNPNNGISSTKSDYTGYERLGDDLADDIFGTDNRNTARDKVNASIAAMCEQAKADNIIVYTVVFTSSVNQTTKNMFKACASDPGKYWYAPDAATLKNVFGKIGNDLTKLRITG